MSKSGTTVTMSAPAEPDVLVTPSDEASGLLVVASTFKCCGAVETYETAAEGAMFAALLAVVHWAHKCAGA